MGAKGDNIGDLMITYIEAVSDKTNRTNLMRAMGNAIVDGGAVSGSIEGYMLKVDYDPANKKIVNKAWSLDDGSGHIVLASGVVNHIQRKDNPHTVTKAQIGLSSVVDLDQTNPANISQTASYRFVTDTEKGTWNGKQDALGFTPVPNSRTINSYALTSNITLTKSDISLANVDDVQQMPLSYLDTDVNLTANSNTKVASQAATKSYVDARMSSGVISSGSIPLSYLDIDGNLTANSDVKLATQKAVKTYVDNHSSGSGSSGVIAAPIGAMMQYGKSTPPAGWLLCDGTAYSRTGTYSSLFGIIGTTYGAGDGSTTFNVPDMSEYFGIDLYYIICYTTSSSIIYSDLIPVGTISQFGSGTIPSGWTACNGDSLLRAGTYSDLFSAIGTNFGSVDSNHFNTPDMSDLFGINLYYMIKYSTSVASIDHTARTDNPHNVTQKQINNILEITGTTYTIQNSDPYNIFIFKNTTSSGSLFLPTLASNQGRELTVINTSSGTINVFPSGTDKINSWNALVPITEYQGSWKFIGSTNQWNGLSDGNSTILEISTETADTGLTLDGTWDDVEGLSLTLTPGKWLVSARVMQRCYDSSNPSYIFGYFGLGTTSGNNAPNIARMFENYNGIAQLANQAYGINLNRKLVDEKYIVNTNTTIYMKMAIESDEMSCTTHQALGGTNNPMYIRARRIA